MRGGKGTLALNRIRFHDERGEGDSELCVVSGIFDVVDDFEPTEREKGVKCNFEITPGSKENEELFPHAVMFLGLWVHE